MKKSKLVICTGLTLFLFSIYGTALTTSNNQISFNVSKQMFLTCNKVTPPWYLKSGENRKSYASFAKKFGIKSNTTFSCFVKPINSGIAALYFYGQINLANSKAILQGSSAVSPYSATWTNSQGNVIQPSQTAAHSALHAQIE